MKVLEITTVARCSRCNKEITSSDIISLRKIEKKKIELPIPEKCSCHASSLDIVEIRTHIKEEKFEKTK